MTIITKNNSLTITDKTYPCIEQIRGKAPQTSISKHWEKIFSAMVLKDKAACIPDIAHPLPNHFLPPRSDFYYPPPKGPSPTFTCVPLLPQKQELRLGYFFSLCSFVSANNFNDWYCGSLLLYFSSFSFCALVPLN